MNTFRIKDLRFRILKGGKIGLAASLMMFGVMFQSTSNAATVINDGNNATGFFVGNTYGSGSTLDVGNANDTTVFTNFFTEGGAGSGGGAGLGGVFFVDQGSTLTLNNTTFKFNTIKGGEGGSLPAQVIEGTSININQLSLGLTAFEQQSINPTLNYSNGNYSFNTIAIATGTKLLNQDSGVVFSELGGTSSTIASVTNSSITLAAPIVIDNTNITSITNNNLAGTGYSSSVDSGKTVITFDYIDNTNPNNPVTDTVLRDRIKDEMTFNAVVAVNNGTIADNATIEKVNYDSNGNVLSVVLSKTLSVAGSSLDIVPVTKFETKPYVVSGNTVTITGATRGFKEGMILYDDAGISTGAKITSVSSDGKTFTVDNPAGLSSIASITAKSTPFLSNNQIQLSAPNPDLVGASSVNINGTDYNISAYNNGTGVITLANPIDSILKSNVEVNGDLLTVKVNNLSVSGNSITLLDKGQNFTTGMQIEGTNLTITNVTQSGGNIVLTLSGNTSAILDPTKITAVDTLTTGGSMNNLASTGGTVGNNGNNGINANYYSSFLNGGEGQAGTRGYAAQDGTGAAGGKGGYGGNGSDGLAVNPQLMTALWLDTADFAEAVGELATALVPDGVPIPSPEYGDLPVAIMNVTARSINLATSIANTVFWAKNLSDGIAGMGGEGGAGGAGGAGDEFFGGGAGGAGGNGGEGALSFTDGGNGGDGGAGGDAGFGAGGGAGGAGGIAGSTGGAEDGGAGDGGIAGFAGGSGSNGDGLYGNGGSGFGGAVFVRKGATLIITGETLFEENSVMAGSSNNYGSAGESAGTALFMMKGSTVNLLPGFGNKIIFNDTIADDSASSYGGASYASGSGADIYIQGNGGLVEFNGENTYSGETYLQGATLATVLGTGINNNSRIVFAGAGTSTVVNGTSYTDTLNLGSVGTLLLSEDLTSRRVGKRSIDVTWEGSGGIASGITDGIVVNFGKITGTTGQELTWGTNGFFESANINKALTFGSEVSLGSVDFQNNVNIGSNTARVAVYNTNLTNNVGSSSAILSGNWVGNELLVGESNYYNGNLILTGTNQLDKLTILDGTTATSGTGKISDSDTKTIVKMYGGKLILENNETLNSVSVNQGALFVSNANLTVDNTIVNDGQVLVHTGTFENNITNDGQFANTSNITVNANITNDSISNSTIALWNQIGTISAENITNNGTWQNQSNVTISTAFVNNGTWYSGQQQVVNNVASWVAYPQSTKNVVTTSTLTGTGTFDVSNGDLEIKQTGNSTFDGTTIGQGSLTKSDVGTLQISNAQTFTGGLNVTGGTFETVSGGTLLDPTYGTLADTNAVHVFKDSTFIAGVVDTVDSVLVDNNTGGTNAGLFDMNENITTQGNFTNNGQLNLDANLTTANTDISTSTNGDFINNGTTTLTADRTVTTAGGLVGATTGIINVNNSGTDLTLNQSGNTTYSGTIVGVGSFIKTGNGNLTLNGVANSIDLGTTDSSTGTFVNAGTLTTASQNVFAADQDITVASSGTLHVKTGSQNVDTITNSGTVNLDDNLMVRILTNNVDGTFNQQADITSTNAIMNGNWNVEGYGVSDYTRVLNTGTLTGDANVTLVDYIDGTTSTASNLKINQSGISIFDGSIAGNGSVEKRGLGKLSISDAQTFTGGLNVTGGTFETLSGGTLADTNAVHVFKDSTFIAGAVDTVGSVLVDAVGTGTTAGRFDMNANITTLGNFTNNGTLELNANLTTGDTNSSNGTNNNFVNNGTTNLTANRTITTEGGLSGLATGTINITNLNQNSNTTLTLNQLGDTTYSGKILGTGSFTKTGNGNLILNGTANSVNLGGTLTIANGKLGLDGAGILNSNLDVIVSTAGELDLISGNQEILALGGQGLINLGSNTLNVTAGGTFTGTVVGSGTLHIGDGDFTVNNNITSQNGTFDVGTTTSNNTGTTTTTTTINETATLTFPDINVKSDGKLDLKGTAESNTVTVLQGGILHLGDSLSTTDHALIDTLTTSIYGTMTGTGTVLGDTIVKSTGAIKPGDSPGFITYNTLTLNGLSSVDMEINNSGIAGVDFDQIAITDKFTIDSGSILNIIKYDIAMPVADELSMGEKVKIFNFTPGKISGYFADVTSTYTNDTILNLQTGEVVGLGGTTIAQFENGVTSNENQRRILADLKVNETNGVAQYYGGQIASRLASNQGNATETKKIFETFSPEVYSSLLEQNKFNLLSSTSKLPTDLENTKSGLSISMDRNTYETDENSNYMSYKMEGNEVKIDHTGKFYKGFIVTSVNAIDGDITSEYTDGSTQNYGINIASVQPLGSEDLTFRAQAGYTKGDSDISRKTYDSTSYAKNIDSSGMMGGLGLGYDKKLKDIKLATTFDLLYYKSQVDGFTESNANAFDALNIHKQDENGVVSKLKVKATKDLTENLSVSGKVEYNKFFNSDNNKVTANVALEDTLINVENQGIGNDIVGLGLGFDYKVNKEWSTVFDAGVSGDKDLTQNNNVGIQVKYAF